MIKIITLILLLVACLITYTLLLKDVPKKEEPQSVQPALDSSKEIKNLQESHTQINHESQKENTQNNKPIAKVKKTVPPKDSTIELPSVELKYYNLSLEKDYNEYYNNTKKDIGKESFPPLNKEEIEEESDFNINVTPEINYNKETKEITVDGVQIQLEKKF